MTWILAGLAAWCALSWFGARLVGRSIHIADQRAGVRR